MVIDSNIQSRQIIFAVAAFLALAAVGIAATNELLTVAFGFLFIFVAIAAAFFRVRFSHSGLLLTLSLMGGNVTPEPMFYANWSGISSLVLVLLCLCGFASLRRMIVLVPCSLFLLAFVFTNTDLMFKLNHAGDICYFLLLGYLLKRIIEDRDEMLFLTTCFGILFVLAVIEFFFVINVFQYLRNTVSAGPLLNTYLRFERPGSAWGDTNTASVHFILILLLLGIRTAFKKDIQRDLTVRPIAFEGLLKWLFGIVSIASSKSALFVIGVAIASSVYQSMLRSVSAVWRLGIAKVGYIALALTVIFGPLLALNFYIFFTEKLLAQVDPATNVSMLVRLASYECTKIQMADGFVPAFLGSLDYLKECVQSLRVTSEGLVGRDLSFRGRMHLIAESYVVSPHNLVLFLCLYGGISSFALFLIGLSFPLLGRGLHSLCLFYASLVMLAYFMFHNGVGSYFYSLFVVGLLYLGEERARMKASP